MYAENWRNNRRLAKEESRNQIIHLAEHEKISWSKFIGSSESLSMGSEVFGGPNELEKIWEEFGESAAGDQRTLYIVDNIYTYIMPIACLVGLVYRLISLSASFSSYKCLQLQVRAPVRNNRSPMCNHRIRDGRKLSWP